MVRVFRSGNKRVVQSRIRIIGSLILAALLQPHFAMAQVPGASLPPNAPAYFPKTWQSALSAPGPAEQSLNGGIGPIIPTYELDPDRSGLIGSYQPSGPTVPAQNAFFQSLGTNGRTCATCHQPASSMSISLEAIRAKFDETDGRDPLFAPVDGANCPNAVPAGRTSPSYIGGRTGHGTDHRAAHSLVLDQGVFRIFLPVPANAEYTISVVSDPNGCNTDPAYNQVIDPTTGAVSQIISVYRRPRIASDLIFETHTLESAHILPPFDPITGDPLATDPYTGLVESGNIMWDGREPTLQSQAIDATLGHAQALVAPTPEQVAEIVNFESGFFSAQAISYKAGDLSGLFATGGPQNLANVQPGQVASLVPGPRINIYSAWSSVTGDSRADLEKASILRGQNLFNNKSFVVSNVAGLNNIPALSNNLVSTCGRCHNQINAGNDSFAAAQHDIGVGGTAASAGGPAPSAKLPIFRLACQGSASTVYNGGVVETNDPGLALITGKCADIGRTTVSSLRGLAARAPYFHDGSARTLRDVVNFYNARFNIGLSDADVEDMVHFLNAL
jgi:hypothetical protein